MAYQQQYTYQPLPVTKYPLLRWVVDVTSSAFRDERFKNIVHLISTPPMSMPVIEFFSDILSSRSLFPQIRTKFMRSDDQVGNLLNLIVQDTDDRKTFNRWLRKEGYALDLICEDIHEEMDAVKPKMTLRSKDIKAEDVMNFDFEGRVQKVLHEDAPTVCRVLHAAAQDSRAAVRNKLKNPEFVRSWS